MFFRMTFASAGTAEVQEAVCRFGEAVRAVFGLEADGGGALVSDGDLVNGH